MISIGTKLDESRGLGKGFDFLRVLLAFAVVAWHTPVIARASMHLEHVRLLWLGSVIILGMFFGLSGFLIAGSALRLGLRDFLVNRGLRIFPALAVEVFLCAFCLGPLLTSFSLPQYASSPLTRHYFTNVVGLINYHLPGVFTTNPVHEVNISLWTVPFEFGCYGLMALLVLSGMLKRPLAVAALGLAILLAGLVMLVTHHPDGPGLVNSLLAGAFLKRGSSLFAPFILGIAAFLLRYRIPYSRKIMLVMVTGLLAVGLIGRHPYPYPEIGLVIDVPMIYIMMYVGVSGIPRLPLFHRGDYSYGIYLYGWPVMQTVRHLLPTAGANALLLFAISVLPITLTAACSWHLIEKPILRLRKNFSFVARQRLAEAAPAAALAGAPNDRPLPPGS